MKSFIAFIAFVLTANVLFAVEPVWRVLKSNDTTAAEVLEDGTATINGAVYVNSLVVQGAATVAPTNSASAGLSITVNGTNYVIALYPN